MAVAGARHGAPNRSRAGETRRMTAYARRDDPIGGSRRSTGGFTLIEITFAIIILAGSLLVLLGLQAAATRSTFSAGKRQEAMLAARALMAAFESGEIILEPQDRQTTMQELLTEFVPAEGGNFQRSGPQQQGLFDGLSGKLRVEKWSLPGLDPDVIQRIELTVAWSDAPNDAVTAIYFLPSGEATPQDEYDE